MMRPRVELALGAMKMLVQSGYSGYVQACGVQEADFELLTQAKPWMNNGDMNRVSNTFQALFYAGTDKVLARYEMPAEMIAGAICMFVHPMNLAAACGFIQRPRTAEQLAKGKEKDPGIPPSMLISLCLHVFEQAESNFLIKQFQTKIDIIYRDVERIKSEGGEIDE